MKHLLLFLALLAAGPAAADWHYRVVPGAGGVPLNVVTAGQPGKPAILFIHGIGQSHYSFHRQLDSGLADEFFLVAFDLRGHGASGKPWDTDAYAQAGAWAGDVAAVIEATGAHSPVVVAWSYGTLVIMDYVREFGAAGLAGINLTGALGALLPFRTTTSGEAGLAEFARIRELQLSPNLADQVAAARLVVPMLTAAPMPPEEQAVFEAISLMLPAYARQAMVSRALDNQDLVEALSSVPLLLSLGAQDNPAMLEDAPGLAAAHGNAGLSVYEGLGHSVFLEDAQRFNAELRRFAHRVRPAADGH